MDYKKIYDQLIEDALNNPKLDSYKELHHIIPKCIGGADVKDNLVKLTARQHYLAHWLLYKIYKTTVLVHAWHCMSRIGDGQKNRNINSHLFQYCKKERSKILSENYKGEKNNFYGKTHTEETKKYLSEINYGRKNISENGLKSWIEKVAKQANSELQKKSLGERNKQFITIQNKITLEKLYIDRNIIHEYDNEIWVNPKKITPDKKSVCEHCGIITNSGNIKRWHNENCKRKIKNENTID